MSLLERIRFGFQSRLPLILQSEGAECGLACIAMIASYHGYATDLPALRRQFQISLKGATLSGLIQAAGQLHLGTRPLKLDLDHLEKLALPCILHWEFNHFVVLESVTAKSVTIHDPACGKRVLPMAEVSRSFTGVALELWPKEDFKPQVAKQAIQFRTLMGRVTGLFHSLAQILVFAAALEAFALISPFFLQWTIDNVLVSGDRDLLTTLAIGFGLLMLLQQTIGSVRSWVLLYMGTTLSIQWRANVFSHLIRLPVQYFDKRHVGDVISRFGTTDIIQRTLTTAFLDAILDGVMAVATLIIMFVYSPMLSAVALAAMLAYLLARWAWYAPLRNATEEQIVHAARQHSHFIETVRGVKAIKLFGREEHRQSSWLALLVDQINAEVRTARLQLLYKFINGILFGCENILIIWLGSRLVIDGNFSVGILTAFIAYKSQFGARVSGLIDKYFELRMLSLQGERLADIVLAEPECLSGTRAQAACTTPAPHISVRGLRFRYAEHEPFLLNDINFEVSGGASIAIVGPSGCGKTTLLNVLLGVLPASAGEVRIDDIPLAQLGMAQLRGMVGTVLQDDVLFAGSISDNICFFDAAADQAWIERCAELASIADDILSMPMAYNTLVGDMGTVLSGGQKQRVLLARALYKRPRILFLDEATSHLDVDKEKQVNQAVRELHMTRIIIAHRPETIASADAVIVMAGGHIIASASSPLPAAAQRFAPATCVMPVMQSAL
ncbi:peptidase domain-containing ABC transporter [Massilia sp. CF038]|uniref:peptidase domain-containing ABC transporter n=1 Tax=Massilia sp. CF038 TaxID=1881045 RepID=UPI0009142F8D|nr:peptidase domain-containing ABC transporter [Massilia sp. CF038]SHG42178.1 colicin V processing peptidase. Cysteine peptidase. MEROPS family C39 [Massilia sp. CF038]